MNDYQKRRFARKIIQCLFQTVSNKRIALFGFTFKKDTADTRYTTKLHDKVTTCTLHNDNYNIIYVFLESHPVFI